MIILIAESKTMVGAEMEVSVREYEAHRPQGEKEADQIMDTIRRMSTPEIMEAAKLSQTMANRLRQLAYEFPNKTIGVRAIEGFTGVVYKNLDYSSFSSEQKERADHTIKIVSSLYGWVNARDIIKPYRLEYNSEVSPDDSALWKFWKPKVTIQLVKYLQEHGETEILDLLPADAAKCVDWKLVKRFAKVWKVDFVEQTGEKVKSPHAGRLKALRGELAREVILNDIRKGADLLSFSNTEMLPIPDYKYSDRIAYMV